MDQPGTDRSSKIGIVIIFLFALPFAAFGVFALSAAIHQLVTGVGDGPIWLPLLFGVIFCGVGFGLMSVVVFGSRMYRHDLQLQAEHPSEPWLWRKDWASGRVQSQTRSNMIGAWIMAALWNAASAPILFIIPRQAAKNPAVLIGAIFPVAGVYLLLRAIRQTIAYMEFGKTYFEMASVPAVIGRELKGMIQARFPHSPDHGVHLRLSCVRRITTGSGNSSSTSEHIVWRDEADLESGQIYPGPAGTTIPVNFRIPWDAEASEKRSPRDATVWLLEAIADVPGVDYHDIFEVPVFRTQQTPAQPEAENGLAASHVTTQPRQMTVEVQTSSAGTEFFFPAARNKGFAATTTLFLLLFTGLTVFLLSVQVPKIFGFGCGFFALLMLYITIQMWFATTRVGIGNGVLRLQAGLLGGGKVQEFRTADIQAITDKISSQQGGATGVPYYDIEMQMKTGRKFTLGRTLRNKRETDWLVQELRRLAGLELKKMVAGSAG
jgi:hypothetical protein